MEEKLQRLKQRIARVRDLSAASAVLGWDEEVMMPPGGVEARGDQLATLDSLAHQFFVDEEVGTLLDDLRPYAAQLPYDSDDASLVRIAWREFEKEVRIPTHLVEEMSRTKTQAHQAWIKARQESNFSIFEPLLSKTVELQKQWAACFDSEDNPYNPLLNKYEPGITYDQIATVFAGVKPQLVKLVAEIVANQDAVDDSVLTHDWDVEGQLAFSREVMAQIGYDFKRGRLDLSAHPFSTTFSRDDSRTTTRLDPNSIASCLMSSIHEAGHGMYEQNTAPSLYRTGLDNGASMAVHESQSRFYENVIGRSRPFWRYFYPRLQAHLPALKDVSLDSFYPALNKSEPSLIRVEADEVTYGLHIILRFELENDMMNDRVKVADLPQEWNARMEQYLGITPPNDALGVLQDIHWSHGYIGYFPDYLLGSMFSVQLWERMQQDITDVEAQVERGEFGALLAWQGEHIHQHGMKFTLPELAQRITGGSLQWEPYMNYLRTKYAAIYGL